MHYFRRECDEEKKFKEVRTKKDQWCKCGRIPILRADSACLPDSFYHGAGSIIYFGRSDFLYGFSLWPKEFSLEAYKAVFKSPAVVAKAYLVTITLTLAGTAIGLLLQTMTAYVLSRRDFEWRSGFSFFFYFTTLFNGGLVSIYILMTRYLGLKNSYLALLLPLLFNVYNLLIMKSYMLSVPESLIDAAKIDGCGDFMMLFQVVMPLVRPALATVGLFIALAYWNDWYNAMLLYIGQRNVSAAVFPL